MWQVPALLFLAALIAVGVNHWRSDGIPLVGNWSVKAQFSDAVGQSLVVGLEEARKLHETQKAIFVDARSESLYREGHIQGALNIPWQEVDRYFVEVMERLDPEKTIITYCDGETCELSHELALFLQEMGFQSVRVLVNGWTVWKEAGLPVGKTS
ncbi:MAG: rhodanese-like domain-containing protein [Deltaproteobacteria bacterium]|nr:rhodanese-like domain-containing protein [Deltaproteobacteria bacterium]